MTNRQHLQSLTDFEYSKKSIVHHMTSDNTIFEFTTDNNDEVWKDAQLHELEWLGKEV